MKKRALMALPNLTATDEMKKIATSDLPRKEKLTTDMFGKSVSIIPI